MDASNRLSPSPRLVVLAALLTACQVSADAPADESRPAALVSTATPSSDPSPSPSLTPPTATAEPSAWSPLAPTLLRVAAPNLTVWAEPDSGGEELGVVTAGTVLYVMTPADAAPGWRRVGLDWHRLNCGEQPCLPVTIGWIGPSAEVVDAAVTCPPTTLEADVLRQMPPLVALGCFGGDELLVTGVVPEPASPFGWSAEFIIEPLWLSSLFGPYIGASGLTLHVDPASDVELPELTPGASVRATGSLNSEAAASCVAKTFPTGPEQLELPTQRDAARLYCRTQFVVTDVVSTP